jgi:hypothetical protein
VLRFIEEVNSLFFSFRARLREDAGTDTIFTDTMKNNAPVEHPRYTWDIKTGMASGIGFMFSLGSVHWSP